MQAVCCNNEGTGALSATRVQQVEAWLFIIAACVHSGTLVTQAEGMGRMFKAETGAARRGECKYARAVGESIRDAGAVSTTIWSRGP